MANRAKSRSSSVDGLDDDDRISKLPDEVRCHILSFLPTVDAVATTLLSTKWRNLWTTALDNIDINDNCRPFICSIYRSEEYDAYRIRFVEFANNVIRLFNGPVMKRFSLNCKNESLQDVHSWVSLAILRKVEDLGLSIHDLYIVENEPIQLPTSVFTCETLEVLKLEGVIFVPMLMSCSLPRLKKLKVSLIHYENDESARKLISSCPSLESLDITRQVNDGVENFIIGSSTLKYLRIEIDQFNRRDSDLCNHVINCPGLQHLELTEGRVNGLFIENLCSLVKTVISFSDALDVELVHHFCNLLRGICNSKSLDISAGRFQLAIPPQLFPKFDRLTALRVTADCCNWIWLQEFIRNSDRLEALEFTKFPCNRKKHVVCWRDLATVPICLLSSLKTVKFLVFDGLRDELAMVKFILKNAKVLQKMEICLPLSLQNKKPRLRQRLLNFRRGSEECQVTILTLDVQNVKLFF